jgi:hypothetical protein
MKANRRAMFNGLERSFCKLLGLNIVNKGPKQGIKDNIRRATDIKGLNFMRKRAKNLRHKSLIEC